MSEPRTRAGRALVHREMFDLDIEEDRRRLAIAIEDEAIVARIHYGDPDDRARSYNQGYDDAIAHSNAAPGSTTYEALHGLLGRVSGRLHLVLSHDRSGQDTPALMSAVSMVDDAIEVLSASDPLVKEETP